MKIQIFHHAKIYNLQKHPLKILQDIIIYLYNILGWSSFPSIRPVVHPLIHPSFHPSKAKRGRVRALLKLQNSTVLGNCPFCPIYSTIGIHLVMKGYWSIIKISSRHWGRFGMQLVQPIFSFFWVLGRRGKGEIFPFFYWEWGSRHSSMEWRRQSCGNLSHSKEVVARSDRP
jgi:hypothetical protein